MKISPADVKALREKTGAGMMDCKRALVDSGGDAGKAEKILKLAKVDFLLIPVPRQLTSDCGLALRFSPEVKDELLTVLANENLSPVELYQRREGAYLAVETG